jgi:hypothetical protein
MARALCNLSEAETNLTDADAVGKPHYGRSPPRGDVS